VLLKSDGLPTYHMAAMIDDHLMEVTHVIRGSEWLSTFPLHVNILRAFGWEEPVWVHLSVFLKPSGKGKLSKRDDVEAIKDGHSIFVGDLKNLGYTPEGVLNWIVLMGWGVAEDDVMSLDEMVERFSIDSLTPSPAAINFGLDVVKIAVEIVGVEPVLIRVDPQVEPLEERVGLIEHVVAHFFADDVLLILEILFADLSRGEAKIKATYIVECSSCSHTGSYDGDDIERYQHPSHPDT